MNIAIASDHGALVLKSRLKEYLKEKGHNVIDCGTHTTESCDYPDYCIPACQMVVEGKVNRAIVMCTTGIGMSICANKIKGIRCALVSKPEIAKITREHNDANVLALGACLIDFETCKEIVNNFLNTPFSEEERHIRRINKIKALEG